MTVREAVLQQHAPLAVDATALDSDRGRGRRRVDGDGRDVRRCADDDPVAGLVRRALTTVHADGQAARRAELLRPETRVTLTYLPEDSRLPEESA